MPPPHAHYLFISTYSLNTCSNQPCSPADPSPVSADSRCSLTLFALLPSPLPSTTDMHKHTPAFNNRGFIQGGHTTDTDSPLSRSWIWTAVDLDHGQQPCLHRNAFESYLKVWAAHAVLLWCGRLAMTSSGRTGVLCKGCQSFVMLRVEMVLSTALFNMGKEGSVYDIIHSKADLTTAKSCVLLPSAAALPQT